MTLHFNGHYIVTGLLWTVFYNIYYQSRSKEVLSVVQFVVLVFFFNALKLFIVEVFHFLVRFIPRHFILAGAIMNEIFFLISFSEFIACIFEGF